MAEVNGIKVPFLPLEPVDYRSNDGKVSSDKFRSVFQHEFEKLKISGHAQKRLDARQIELSTPAMEKLQDAVQKAELKGAKDSLIMMDNTAYIVSIPNKTIVTAMGLGDTSENIFTNIDSVVFL